MESLRYVMAALALGLIAFWSSETLFWIIPPAGLGPGDLAMTVTAYALTAAVAVSVVILTGAGGIGAAFLGGAALGFMTEGVVVGTMYQAFPLQVVWTPLAWHALITGAWVVGTGRLTAVWGPGRMALNWLALGVFGGVWALWWPEERPVPGLAALAVYVVGTGLLVPVGHIVLDHLRWPQPPRPVLFVVPVLAALLWLAQGIADPNPARLALPLVLAGMVWLMRRLPARQGFGPPARQVWHHALFLLAPVVTCLIAVTGWAALGQVGTNGPVALITGAVSLGGMVRLWWRARR